MVMATETTCNKVHGVNDSQRDLIGDILAGASILAAAYNATRAVEIATAEWKLAKKYWQIAQNWLDYYKDYFAPVEDQEIAEASNIDITEPLYEAAQGRARATAFLEFRGILSKTIRCTSKYCTGLRADMLTELTAAQADAVAMADGLGYRNERAYVEARNEVRFEKMLNTAKRGRDMIAENVSLAKATASIYGDLFEQAWSGLSGAGEYLGYWNNRNDTHYPTSYVTSRAQIRTNATSGDALGAALGDLRERYGNER